MNICLPYTDVISDLFRCLLHDLNIPFTPAPPPGKYTREIGKSFAAGALCPGLEKVLGSIVECAYLGADTAVVFAPCGECRAARIRLKLQNSLALNALQVQVVGLEEGAVSQKAFWEWLKAESSVSGYAFRQAKKRFLESCSLADRFLALKSGVQKDTALAQYIEKGVQKLKSAQSLPDIKLLLLLYNKRMEALASPPSAPVLAQTPFPYSREVYFLPGGEMAASLETFFQTKGKKRNTNGEKTPFLHCEYCL